MFLVRCVTLSIHLAWQLGKGNGDSVPCFPVTPDSECLVKLIPLSTLGETEHSNDEPGSDPKSVSPCRHRRGHRAPWGGNADIAELNLKGIWLLLGLLDLDCSGIIRGVTLKKLKSFG
uniref:Uncharacterized protein n=1 Tax=Amorphochlora amoebiformis TaxID=1561963 RepID=A0A7S0DN41_9EUKA|mmetsp:Transcript_35015/g.56517  ORF Transcript_35015/g.56517 Transcript_35015/m.56517 type:complete len:118 (+) Transcript_35015:306-659(+)